jgi:hypothetical protein
VHKDPAYPLIPVLSARADLTELPSFLSQFQGVADLEGQPAEFQKLLRGVPWREARAQIAAEPEPFVGLEAFDSRKAYLFFGRELEIGELLDSLRREALVMVVGDSGSGKSSLVKAGLVSAFRGGRLGHPRKQGPDETLCHVVETRPGNDPFARLADDLRKAAEAAGKRQTQASEKANGWGRFTRRASDPAANASAQRRSWTSISRGRSGPSSSRRTPLLATLGREAGQRSNRSFHVPEAQAACRPARGRLRGAGRGPIGVRSCQQEG